MRPAPVLEDGDLRLRPVSLPQDTTVALPWYQDPEVMRLSEGDFAARYDEGTILAMYRYLLERGEVFIIELGTPDGWAAIGDAALCPDLIPIVIGVAEYRSKGWGSRVLRMLIDRARALAWRRIGVSGVYTYNPRARRLYEAAGFRMCGLRREDGRPEMWTFELLLDGDAAP